MIDLSPVEAIRPLSEIKPGRRVRLWQVNGGRGLRSKLSAMGLIPGIPIDVVAVNGGPMILSVMGGRLVLGRGMAMRILVREAEEEQTA